MNQVIILSHFLTLQIALVHNGDVTCHKFDETAKMVAKQITMNELESVLTVLENLASFLSIFFS